MISPEFGKALFWVVVGAAVVLGLAAIWAVKPEVDSDLDDRHTDALSPVRTVDQATDPDLYCAWCGPVKETNHTCSWRGKK